MHVVSWVVSGRDCRIFMGGKLVTHHPAHLPTKIDFAESFEQSPLNNASIHLIANPDDHRERLREKFLWYKGFIPELFATTVFLCDEYFVIGDDTKLPRPINEREMQALRFWRITRNLPMELQMVNIFMPL